jgi:hypothetical protein
VSDGPRPDLRGIESETEEIDAIAVPVGEGPLPALAVDGLSPNMHTSRPHGLALLRSTPTVQVAAAAAGGLLAGAAVLGLARRRHAGPARSRRRLLSSRAAQNRRGGRGGRGGGELLQIVGSRSLLVDVHLLDAGTGRAGRR